MGVLLSGSRDPVCETPGTGQRRWPLTESRTCPVFFPSPASATARGATSSRGQRPTLRRDRARRARCAAARATRTTRSGSSSPTPYDAAAAATLATWQRRRRARHRRPARVLRLPHGLHRRRRQSRSAPPACSAPSRSTTTAAAILPHERTLPKAKTDRLELLRATRANLDPIWGLSLAGGLSSHLQLGRRRARRHRGRRRRRPPLALDRRRPRADRDHLRRGRGSELVVLADGHHRFETAATTGANDAPSGIDDPGADAIMTLVVELADRPALRARRSTACSPASATSNLRDALGGPFFVARRRAEHARGRRRARGRDARRRRPRPGRPRRPRAAHAHRRARARAWPTSRPSCATSTRRASTPACSPRCPT